MGIPEGWPDKECLVIVQVSDSAEKQAEKIRAGLKMIKNWYSG